MLDRVGETFLDEPVCGQVDSRRQLGGLALDLDLDGQSGLARLSHEPVEMLEARLRSQCGRFFGPAQNSDEPPHLGQRLAARLLDDLERLALLFLVGLQPAPDRARLDGHHAHAVPDDVVQLASDPCAFLGDRGPCLFLLFTLQLLGPLLRGPSLLELPTDGERSKPEDAEEQGDAEEITRALSRGC